jgi:hypothetical protein
MRRFLTLSSVLFLLTACQTLPVYTVENAEIFTSSGKTPTLAEVRQAIIQGAASKTWSVKELDSNTIVARVGKKTIEAVVTIEYSQERYSIRYRDSTNLSYRDGMIRSRYNSWVKKLRARIETYLAGL